MENQVQIFENPDLGEIRVLTIEEEPWWVLVDVCRALHLSTSTRVAARLDEDEVSLTHVLDSRGCSQKTTVINESGLYSVILRSDKL